MIIYISPNPNKKRNEDSHNTIKLHPELLCCENSIAKAFIIILNLQAALVGGFEIMFSKMFTMQTKLNANFCVRQRKKRINIGTRACSYLLVSY